VARADAFFGTRSVAGIAHGPLPQADSTRREDSTKFLAMNESAGHASKSSMRTLGAALPIVGVLLALCGLGYTVVYYNTGQFFDLGESFAWLADLSYGNLVAGSGSLCCGGVLAVIGLVLFLVGRRRAPGPS
jgi:hypothetical protein